MDLSKVTPTALELLHEEPVEGFVELFPAYSLGEIRSERDRMITVTPGSSCSGGSSPGERP